jgi:hypothetical protein
MSNPEESDPVDDTIAKIRAAHAAVDEAIKLAARTAEKNHRSRGDFLQHAERAWDELFETEEAKQAKIEARRASWAAFIAERDKPENVAAHKAAEEARRAREAAAKAARSYPVLYPAKKLGRVVAVYEDGLVRIGTMQDEAFVPLSAAETGRVIRFEGGGMCPEQHEAFIGEQQVGYLRLRHGMFRADYPECMGETVLTGCPMGDGEFEPEERPEWLDRARAALYEAWREDWVDASDEDIEAEVERQQKARLDEDERNDKAWSDHMAEVKGEDDAP